MFMVTLLQNQYIIRNMKKKTNTKIDDMKQYLKLTQEKIPAQIIIYVVTTNWSVNENPDKIVNEIVELAKSFKTNKDNVVVSSIVSRKDQ